MNQQQVINYPWDVYLFLPAQVKWTHVYCSSLNNNIYATVAYLKNTTYNNRDTN